MIQEKTFTLLYAPTQIRKRYNERPLSKPFYLFCSSSLDNFRVQGVTGLTSCIRPLVYQLIHKQFCVTRRKVRRSKPSGRRRLVYSRPLYVVTRDTSSNFIWYGVGWMTVRISWLYRTCRPGVQSLESLSDMI